MGGVACPIQSCVVYSPFDRYQAKTRCSLANSQPCHLITLLLVPAQCLRRAKVLVKVVSCVEGTSVAFKQFSEKQEDTHAAELAPGEYASGIELDESGSRGRCQVFRSNPSMADAMASLPATDAHPEQIGSKLQKRLLSSRAERNLNSAYLWSLYKFKNLILVKVQR